MLLLCNIIAPLFKCSYWGNKCLWEIAREFHVNSEGALTQRGQFLHAAPKWQLPSRPATPPSPFWPALTLPHRQLTQHDQERIWQQQQRRLQKAALWTILKIVLDSCRGRISATASDCEMHGGCVFWVECTHTHISFCGYRSSPAVSCDVWLRRGSTFTSILRGVTFCVQARYTKGVCVCIGI